jgi:hypothetical protein
LTDGGALTFGWRNAIFCIALLWICAVVISAREALADDFILPASISGLSIYTNQYGAIITPQQGGCVINAGANVYLAADSFHFGPGFRVQAGATLTAMKATYDSLFDAWLIKYFGNNYTQGPYSDYCGNGLNNLADYQLGLDPTNPVIDVNQLPHGPGTYYVYDNLGRLSGVYKFSSTGLVYGSRYQYDAIGNRTQFNVSVGK